MTTDEKLKKIIVKCAYCGELMEIKKLDDTTVEASCSNCKEKMETYYYTLERIKTIVNLME